MTVLVKPFLLIALVLSGCSDQSSPGQPLAVGSPFPALTATTLEGEAIPLNDMFSARITLLNVWATWCAPCRREMPALGLLQERLAVEGLLVVGLSVDRDVNLVKEFILEYQVKFLNFVDSDGKMARERLGIGAYPQTFLIDARGKLLQQLPGERQWDDPRLIETIRSALRATEEP